MGRHIDKAATLERAKRQVLKSSPYRRFLRDPNKNDEAFAYVMSQPVKAASIYLGYLARQGELLAAHPDFPAWPPEEQIALAINSLSKLYNEGGLGGVVPLIIQDMRAHPEKFGHANRDALERVLSSAPDDVQQMAAEAERLESAEGLALRAVEREVEAGKVPHVLLEGEELRAAIEQVKADPQFQRRSAVERAYEVHDAELQKHAPRFGDGVNAFTDREYRENIVDNLRRGWMQPAEALDLWLYLDKMALQRGELRPYVPTSDRELAVRQANRTAEVLAALEAGKMPPPATEYVAQEDGLTPRYGSGEPRPGPKPLDPSRMHLARWGLKMPQRDALNAAYEQTVLDETGDFSPELTGRPTEEDLAHDAEVSARIDAGTESLRDLVEAAWDMHGEQSEGAVDRSVPVSRREALSLAYDSAASDAANNTPAQPSGESLRDALERAWGDEESR